MAYEIVMPQLSDSMEEGKLISWKVKPGDRVKVGDVIAEVESDKAIMEVQSFKDGVVKSLKLEEGKSAPVGTVIAEIETGEQAEKAPKGVAEVAAAKPAVSAPPVRKEEEKKESPPTVSTKEAAGSVDELFGAPAKKRSEPTAAPPVVEGRASPKAKALAAKLGVDIAALQKSGDLPEPLHASQLRDYYERRYFTPKALQLLRRYRLSTDLFEKGRKHDEAEIEAYIREHDIPLPRPMDAIRKAIVATVTESAKRPVYHIYDAIDARLIMAHETKERTVTVWILKLLAEAMMRHEAFRTTLAGDALQVWPVASISVAMADGEALYMPVVRNVETLTVDEIAKRLAELKERVRSRALGPEELKGSTFGLSNLGMTGIERFDAMIYGEDMGIAAVGAERDGTIAVTLTCDHRIVDGYEAARFMQTLKTLALKTAFFKNGG
ncbi:dihydrolipoamide acetyltransferase family protein [Hydrogenimonas sp.]